MQNVTDTTTGPVEGKHKEGGMLFAGIPYAAPPVAQLRFQAAQPHPIWSEPLAAFKFGPAAPQVPTGGMTDSAPVRWDEDCLTLNIHTPNTDDKKRAVLVWIHGGHYRSGQSSIPWYNGARFADNQDIVVVSINYRLGALGFTDLSNFGAEFAHSGVNGILDQITALTWIRDNIQNFGGDPDKVTIAGESAGAFATSTLLGCARADGLFRAAIPQSGAAHNTLNAADGRTVGEHFLRALKASGPVEFQGASVDAVLAAQAQVVAELETGPGKPAKLTGAVAPFYPVVGNSVLPISPLEAIRSGHNAHLPVLIGSNRDETTLFGYGAVDRDKLARTAQAFGAESLLDAYASALPNASDHDLMIALTSDHMFRIPAIRLAEAREAHGAKTWLYQFNWESRAFEGRLKATHALEIPFAFNNLDRAGVNEFIGPGERPQPLADAMHNVWSQFVRDGDAPWDSYNEEERVTMVFDETCAPEADPAGPIRGAWAGLR